MDVNTIVWLIKVALVILAAWQFYSDRPIDAIVAFCTAAFITGFQMGIHDVESWAEVFALSSDELFKGWFCGSLLAGGIVFGGLWVAPDVLKIQQHIDSK